MKLNRRFFDCIAVVVCIAAFFLYIGPILLSSNASISPDETANSYFSTIFSESGDLSYVSEFVDINPGFFRPRGTVLVENHSVASSKFLGYPIIAGSVESYLGSDVVLYIIPLFAALGLYFLYLIVRREFDRKIAIFSTAFAAILSSVWYWSSMYWYEDALGFFFILIGTYFFLEGLDKLSRRSILLSMLFFGFTLLIKPYYLVIMVPVIILMLANKDLKNREIPILISPFIMMGMIFMVGNFLAYGDPFTTGFHLLYNSGEEVIPVSDSLDWGIVIDNYLDYLIFIFPLSLIGGIGIIEYVRTCRARKGWVTFPFFVIMSFLLLTGYIFILSGTTNPDYVHHSVIRYLMVFPAFLAPFAIFLIFRVGKLSVVFTLVIALLLVVPNLMIITDLNQIMDTRDRYASYNERICELTEEDSIIICQYVDKIYFPSRTTANPAFLDPDNREFECAKISAELVSRGYDVYLVKDRDLNSTILDYSMYEYYLNMMDLDLIVFHKGLGFYQVVFNNTAE